MLKINVSGVAPRPTLHMILPTMQRADRRLKRLTLALAVAFLVMTLLTIGLGCSTAQLINEALDQGTLLLVAMLPLLYWSGRRQ